MVIRKRLYALLLAVMLLHFMVLVAFAHDAVDFTRKGSITVTMRFGNTSVPGGTLTCYRVGTVGEHNGDFSFELTGDFAGCGESLEDIQSVEMVGNLVQYVENNSLEGITETVDENGTAFFGDLAVGLYLIVQKQAAEGYNRADPFLVSVPTMESGVYVYDVDASPKAEVEKEPTEPGTSEPDDPKLPQTGQLNWPVPVLVVLGLSIFSIGWVLRFGKKDD